jgi:tRNA-splicing ligase RtcB
MMAVQTTLNASNLPDDLAKLRAALEKSVPHGRTDHGGRNDRGAFSSPPPRTEEAWKKLRPGYEQIIGKYKSLDRGQNINQLGTLGGGNHFIEICLDEADRVWVMLHSGSRGVGNRIGMHFINLAQKDMREHIQNLPDKNLAYFSEGSPHFNDYVEAVDWAQRYARENRRLMMASILEAMGRHPHMPRFKSDVCVVNCHHNYVQKETHFGEEVYLTRKGAVSAREGELGIIPGSMGAKSFIVRGKGNPNSFHSCSHGAGRVMSRTEANRRFTVEDHIRATEGVECRKDAGVIDEIPMAYKPIELVMAAQADLVEPIHTLKQILCIKG